jgi:hypothetical protein
LAEKRKIINSSFTGCMTSNWLTPYEISRKPTDGNTKNLVRNDSNLILFKVNDFLQGELEIKDFVMKEEKV